MLFKTSTLSKIKAPIAQELADFEVHFKESMKSNVPLLDKITYYIVQRKGKQVRPIFVFLCAQITGGINKRTHIASSFIEILHTASLVHDDVVDDSYERRGFFSINALWKNKIAVIVGDYLLSKGLLLAVEHKEYIFLELISKAVKDMAEGELMQLEKARRLDIEEDVYYKIIRQKTASLIAAACAAGAASATKDEAIVEKMRLFGETIGIAFQIKDDLFDYGNKAIGKPRGIDIKEKKMTLPLIYALSKADKSTKKSIIKSIKKKSSDPKVIQHVITFVKESGGLDYAKLAMNKHKSEAMEILDSFPNSEYKEALINLVNYVIEREK
ncbi:polyprenyl synthetase family protein [bacterium]|nr:polyprenyl synthetase family protein [bacterium]